MTAPTVPAVAWLDPHEATVTLPDGSTARVFYDWDREAWTSDRDNTAHADYADVLRTLSSTR